jgi:restriction system protein
MRNYFNIRWHQVERLLGATYEDVELFQEVLVRHGFGELKGQPLLLKKLLFTTTFNSEYSGFSEEIGRHIKDSLEETLQSWIEEVGPRYRENLLLIIYNLWERQQNFNSLNFNA